MPIAGHVRQGLTLRTLTLSLLVASLCGPAAASASHYNHLLAPSWRCPGQTDAGASLRTQARAMYCLTHYARLRSGAPALRASRLMYSADRKANDVVSCQEFSHTACGRDFAHHVRRIGYATACWGAAENLAAGSGPYGSPRSTMAGWLHSDGHRENLLSPSLRDYGIGLAEGRLEGYPGVQVWVTHFGFRC